MSVEVPKRGADKPATNPGWLGALWLLSTAALLNGFWWVHNMALVIWVYGWNAYFQGGLRVLPGKPTKFSNGDLVPDFPDMITGFGYFFLVAGVTTSIYVILLTLYGRRFRKKRLHHLPNAN